MNIDGWTLLCGLLLLGAHWFGDFFLQTDEMALNKSASNGWLTAHVAVYTGVLFVVTVSVSPWYALVNGGLHWGVDYGTSRWTSHLYKAGRRHDFFVVVGLDQMIHTWCLGVTAWWLL